MERFFLALGQRLHRNRTIVLLLVAGVTLVLGLAAGRSTVDNSIGVWQTENDPHWLHFQEFAQRHQLVDPLVVYLPGASPEGAREINSAARKITEVERTTLFHLGLPAQGSLLLLFPKAQSSPPQLAGLIREVKHLIAKQLPGQTTHLGGVWYLTDTLDSLSASSTQRLFPLVIVILALGVLLFLRNLRHTALALVCGLLPALHLTGLLALAHEPLNVILLALPPLTMILGITHAIHLLKKDTQPEPFTIYAQVAPPCLLCALTTMLGFLSLLVSAYTPVQKLGLWGAIGSVLSLITTLLLLPLFSHGSGATPVVQPPKQKNLLGQIIIGHKNRILFAVAGLVALSLWGMLHLEKGSFILAFFKPEAAISRDYRAIEQAGIGLTPLEIDLDDCPAQSRAIQQAMLTLAQRHPEITHFFSFYDERGKIALPMATANGASLDTPLLPSLGLQAPIRLTILTRTLASEKTMRMVDAMEGELQDLLGAKPTPYVTGTVPLYTRGQREMFTTLVQTFGLAFLSVSLVMGLALRSLRLAILAIIPNFVPVLYLLGTMGLFGIPLSVASVTVASIVFGVVVDDTIHFMHTWQEMTTVTDPHARLHRTISHTALAMFTSSIVTATGFLGFLVSPFMPLRDFGLLISLSLLYGIICDLLLLPALLLTFGTAKGEKP
ncbi:MAG: MMPL family transporter [Deltaproteobacteria bacterium]|nr:MMPL family transporter [Deltaproteobacteria bacterium]